MDTDGLSIWSPAVRREGGAGLPMRHPDLVRKLDGMVSMARASLDAPMPNVR
jgi:hypothetical protein